LNIELQNWQLRNDKLFLAGLPTTRASGQVESNCSERNLSDLLSVSKACPVDGRIVNERNGMWVSARRNRMAEVCGLNVSGLFCSSPHTGDNREGLSV
jgi:hypothetical protein